MAKQQPPPDGLKVTAEQRRGRERSDAVKRWAQRKLDALNDNRSKTVAPAAKSKRTKGGAKRKDKPKSTVATVGQVMVDEIVTPEAQRHGDYRYVPVKLQEVTEGGKRVQKEGKAVRNLALTQIDRWQVKKKLDERQMAGIMFYTEAYRRVFGQGPRVTANYSPAIARNAAAAIQTYAHSWMAARESLRLLDNEVFLRGPVDHFEVWQNVVIWDEPAGVAGGRIGFCHKPAEAIALLIVQRTAHEIANVVIDNSRHDYARQLADLDTPQKAKRGKP